MEKIHLHPAGGDVSHAPTTAIYAYIHTLQDYTGVKVTAQRPRVFPSTATQQRPLVRVGVRARVRVKNSLEVFCPHGDLDSLLSSNLSMYVPQVCIV